MLKRKPGLAIVETIMVIAISGLLFAVVIGTFSIRRRADVDDAARQVMSEIARVRNQAQQGYIPENLKNQISSGNELYGMAISLQNDTNEINVYYLQQNPTNPNKTISIIGTSPTKMSLPSKLEWYINTSSAGFSGTTCSAGQNYNSCVLDSAPSNNGYMLSSNMWLVFRNNTAQSYLLQAQSGGFSPNLLTYQPTVQFAFAQPGSGSNFDAQISNATAKYLANFNLAIPNNQSLRVVK